MSKQLIPGGEINWYSDKVEVHFADVSRRAMEAVAALIDQQAKINIVTNDQVDTGFMVNSVYFRSKEASSYGAAKSATASLPTKSKGLNLAPMAELPEGYEALVCVGANYAIFQEMANPFLYPALLKAAGQAGGTIEKVATNA